MTERLFENNSYIKEFSAVVTECVFDGEYYNVCLDKTAFSPEGGGQKGDKGSIADAKVFAVLEEGEKILHKTNASFNVGDSVTCQIDWEDRFSKMQNHTGEHIVSGIIKKNFSLNNVGFHLGDEVVTLDVDGKLDKPDIELIEKESNQVVYDDKEIIVSYPSVSEQESLDFRSKIAIKENLRLVEIKDCDLCACCAPHVKSTGEVGNIKIIDFAPHRKGTRITLVCGNYLIRFIEKTNKVLGEVYKSFSANSENVIEKINLLKEDCQLSKKEIQTLNNELALTSLMETKYNGLSFAKIIGADFDGMKFVLNGLLEKENCVLLVSSKENQLLYMLSSKDDYAEKVFNLLRENFVVKGSLRNNFSQGKIEGEVEKIEKVIGDKL